jgi:hypothetical protein
VGLVPEGGASRNRRSPGAGGSLHPGDDPTCPEQADVGNYCVRGGTDPIPPYRSISHSAEIDL